MTPRNGGSAPASLPAAADPAAWDLLRVPLVGRFLRWRHSRAALQWPLLGLAALVAAHGLFGPSLAPKNLATLLVWVHYRGLLVLALLAAGNAFCFACPFMLPREAARRLRLPAWNWPRPLRNKGVGIALLVLVLYAYELFDLWGAPFWTAVLIVGYFAAALAVDALFRHASFCKFVCPIGQFNFIASTMSPLEVAVRDRKTCADCRTKDCIRGARDPESPFRILQRGCELALFQPRKTGNVDCTFCLDCVHACPHDNIGILSRLPGAELAVDPHRSGVGRFSQRKDLALLAVCFVYGALLNAFGMVRPVYAFHAWVAGLLGLRWEAPVLALTFFLFLVVAPVLTLGGAAWLTRSLSGRKQPLTALAVRYVYALVPLGLGVWVAHYAFHFLTGLWTFIPVTQYALDQLGWPLLGAPNWSLGGLPAAQVYPLELGFLGLGLVGSLMTAYRIAEREEGARPLRAFLPWAALCGLLFAAALWLLSQPMEMRGTFLGT